MKSLPYFLVTEKQAALLNTFKRKQHIEYTVCECEDKVYICICVYMNINRCNENIQTEIT